MRRQILELLKEGPFTERQLSARVHVPPGASLCGTIRALKEEGWIEGCERAKGHTVRWRLVPHVCDTCCHMCVHYEDPDPRACGQGTLTYEECSVIDEMTDSDVEDANDGLCPMWGPLVDEDGCDLFLQEAMP